jgi:vacuolar-type H+-ATPase subunit E/Vma4
MVNFILQEAHEKANEIRVKVGAPHRVAKTSDSLEAGRARKSSY